MTILITPAPTEPSSDESSKSSARYPLTAVERAAWAQQQWARPRCVSCSRALLLIRPGRDRCERCVPSPWAAVAGNREVTTWQ